MSNKKTNKKRTKKNNFFNDIHFRDNKKTKKKSYKQNYFDQQDMSKINAYEYAKKQIDLLDKNAGAKEIIECLQNSPLAQSNQNVEIKKIIKFLQNLPQKDNCFYDIHSITKAKLEARRNLEMSMYEEVLINELREDGHDVHIVTLAEIEAKRNKNKDKNSISILLKSKDD